MRFYFIIPKKFSFVKDRTRQFDFYKKILYNNNTINKNERYIPMITTNDVLTRLRNGESMDTIGQSIADVLNAAQDAYRAEQEAAKQAESEMVNAKRELAMDLVDLIQAYGELVAPETADLLDDIDDEDIDAMVQTLDDMFHMMSAVAQLKVNLEKAQPKSRIVPATKTPKSDDEVLSNFIKSLM
jgi:flagellar hook-basal body complex protein FliE